MCPAKVEQRYIRSSVELDDQSKHCRRCALIVGTAGKSEQLVFGDDPDRRSHLTALLRDGAEPFGFIAIVQDSGTGVYHAFARLLKECKGAADVHEQLTKHAAITAVNLAPGLSDGLLQ